MRSAWLVLVSTFVTSTAFAAPPKPVRKPPPPSLDAKALDYYVDALLHDKAGEYERAVNSYRSLDEEKLPAILYNIADLYRRMDEPARAIEWYTKYLELAPNAPDQAAVQKLIEQLAKTPASIYVDGDDFDAVVFIDGKPAGPSPLATQLADGRHVVDRIGPSSYQSHTVHAKPMLFDHVHATRDATGNVVLSTSSTYGGTWTDGDKTFRMGDRFTLPPGRVDTYYFKPGRACSPLSFEVPTDGVVYVYVEELGEKKRDACVPIKVTAQKIAFPKVSK